MQAEEIPYNTYFKHSIIREYATELQQQPAFSAIMSGVQCRQEAVTNIIDQCSDLQGLEDYRPTRPRLGTKRKRQLHFMIDVQHHLLQALLHICLNRWYVMHGVSPTALVYLGARLLDRIL